MEIKTALRMEMNSEVAKILLDRMTYKYDEKSALDLTAYFQKYKNELPKLAIITEGVYGKTKFDDFPADQVIRFHRVITQERVMSKQSTISGKDNFLSIPVDTKVQFHVVIGRNRLGPKENLKTILRNHKLPVLVSSVSKLPTVENIPDGQQCQLLVTEQYTEYYLQGHCLTNDQLNPKDMSSVIVISVISAANIHGMTGKTEEEFQQYKKELDNNVKSNTRFKDNDVDTELRVIEVKKDIPREDPSCDDEYTYVETPTPVPRKPVNSGKSDPNLERPLPSIPTSSVKEPPALKSRGPLPPVPKVQSMYRRRPYENTKLQKCTDAPVVQDDEYTDTHAEDNDDQEDYTDLCELEVYGDDVTSSGNSVGTTSTSSKNESSENEDRKSHEHDISDKSIVDITNILYKLNLSKYSEKFTEDMVDGMTLTAFTADELKKEYGMRHAEAVRLMNYVRRGHIPQ